MILKALSRASCNLYLGILCDDSTTKQVKSDFSTNAALFAHSSEKK
jgi:hypothetical protein